MTRRGADSEVPAALGSCVALALALSCRAAALQQPSDLCAGATRALRGTLPFLTPATAASTAWSLVAEEGGKLHAMDEWIDRLAQAQVATEVERMRRAPKGGERIYSSPSAISNQILSSFFCVAGGAARLRHRMAWPARGSGLRESGALPRPRAAHHMLFWI